MKHFAIVIALFIAINVGGEENTNYTFSHYTTANGLPNSVVNCISQSSKGFLWIGTNNGLARFDGFEFKVFQPDSYNPNSLAYKSVENIIEDKNGNLWLYLQSGAIDCFDPVKLQFTHFKGLKVTTGSINRNSTCISFKDKDYNIWFGSNEGILHFNNNSKQLNSIKSFNNKAIDAVYAIKQDVNNTIWLGTEKGLIQLNRQNSIDNWFLKDTAISGIECEANGDIWISTYDCGLFYYSATDLLIKKVAIPGITQLSILRIFKSQNGHIYLLNNKPQNTLYLLVNNNGKIEISKHLLDQSFVAEYYGILEDTFNNVWISSSVGLFALQNAPKQLIKFRNDPSIASSISGNYIGCIFLDKTNVLWISSYKEGLDKLDLLQKPFQAIVKNNSGNNTLSENHVFSILEDDNRNLWFGTFGSGICRKDYKTGKFTHFNIEQKNSSGLQSNATIALLQDKTGNIWAGSHNGGIDVINPVTGKITSYSTNSKPALNATGIRKMVSDNNGNIWMVSANNGLIEFLFKSKEFVYHSLAKDANYMEYGTYLTCFIDSRQRIWVGTLNGGIVQFNSKGNIIKRIFNEPENTNSLINNTVYSIYEDNNGYIWISTSAGLDKYNEATQKFIHYTTYKGLTNNTVYSVLPDNQNRLWINTDYGLNTLDVATDSFINFYSSDGLISNEFNSTAFFKGKNNTIYYGTSKGVIYFNPEEIKPNPYPSYQVITGIKILNQQIEAGTVYNNRVILEKDISNSKRIVLTPKEYLFSVSFSSLNYASSGNLKFRYKLEPLDNVWYQCNSNQRSITYSNLNPGDYVLKIHATNSDGRWDSANEAVLQITILPPFYKTIWFKSIFIILLLAIGVIVYYSRIYRLRERQKKLENIVDSRTKMWQDSVKALEKQKQEIENQKEKLESSNTLLREQQERILTQNIEIETHRNHLQKLVEVRTNELNISRKKAEEASQLKSAFLANMSHEIRTPMNAIVGFSNLLSTIDYSDAQKSEFLGIIKKNSESLLVIIDDIIDLSKIQSEQLSIYRKSFPLKAFIMDIYQYFRLDAEDKKLSLEPDTHLINENIELYSDPVRLKQIFVNLLNNAIKFTEKGAVTFGIKEVNPDLYVFFVRDTGPGISPDMYDAVFERFTKMAKNPGDYRYGAGLGLSISKSLTELLGGKIWIDSVIDKGTTLYFTVPFMMEKYEQIQAEIAQEEPKLNDVLKDKNILVVEDEEANYKVLQAYLRFKKMNCIYVANGQEAIDAIKENNTIDAVLMDIRMPVMDGISALKHIRKLNPSLPIIAQTAFATLEEREAIEAKGFDNYLVKPISQVELYKVLFNIFTSKK